MTTKIELITCPSGDWEVLMLNGKEFASGHSIANHVWLQLLVGYDFEVNQREISDEEMEGGYYK